MQTFEDKEWSKRVLGLGYEIDFSPSIFAYDIKRTPEQKFFRFKNEVIGGYQLWHTDFKKTTLLKNFIFSILSIIKRSIVDLYYTIKKFFFVIKFIFNKPKRF